MSNFQRHCLGIDIDTRKSLCKARFYTADQGGFPGTYVAGLVSYFCQKPIASVITWGACSYFPRLRGLCEVVGITAVGFKAAGWQDDRFPGIWITLRAFIAAGLPPCLARPAVSPSSDCWVAAAGSSGWALVLFPCFLCCQPIRVGLSIF